MNIHYIDLFIYFLHDLTQNQSDMVDENSPSGGKLSHLLINASIDSN